MIKWPRRLSEGIYILGLCLNKRIGFSLFFVLDHPFVTLLNEYSKGKEQAVAATKGLLMQVNLIGCEIGDQGAEIVAEFLQRNSSVISFALHMCKIGPRGAYAIAEAIKHNRTVKWLDVNNNQILDEGAEALIEAFEHNVCITWLNVFSNRISPDAEAKIEYLADTRNKTLIPAAVRRASLFFITACRTTNDAGTLACLPKEIVKMIAIEVWTTRFDPVWIKALSESERTGRLGNK